MTNYKRIPKVELHLHLEGAIPYAALWESGAEIRRRSCRARSGRSETEIRLSRLPALHRHVDLEKPVFCATYEDFTFIAEAVARDLASQNVRYVEAFYSPSDFSASRITPAGIDNGHPHRPRPCARNRGRPRRRPRPRLRPGKRHDPLAELHEVRDLGVIGIGIGGSEQLHPPEPFADVYEKARRLGFHTSAHAGEAAGAESIWGAIRALRVERIGHGTRAEEDSGACSTISPKTPSRWRCARSPTCARASSHPSTNIQCGATLNVVYS